jgi:hypothetical protein
MGWIPNSVKYDLHIRLYTLWVLKVKIRYISIFFWPQMGIQIWPLRITFHCFISLIPLLVCLIHFHPAIMSFRDGRRNYCPSFPFYTPLPTGVRIYWYLGYMTVPNFWLGSSVVIKPSLSLGLKEE